MVEHGLAVGRRHFPVGEHTECVRKRPAHCGRDLAGGTDRQRANVPVPDRERERPFLPQHCELLRGLLAPERVAVAQCWPCSGLFSGNESNEASDHGCIRCRKVNHHWAERSIVIGTGVEMRRIYDVPS